MSKPPPKPESIKRLERYHKQKAREALEREQQEQKRLERNRRARERRHAKAAAKAMSSQNLSTPSTPTAHTFGEYGLMQLLDNPDLLKDQATKELVLSAIKAELEVRIERERTEQLEAHGRSIEAFCRNLERAGENLDRCLRIVEGSGNRQHSEEAIMSIFQMGRQLNLDDQQASVTTMDTTDDIKINTEQMVAVSSKSSDDQDDDESHFKGA
jgi:hypothetical protein